METLAFAIGRNLAHSAGEEFNERDMRERFQRHFRADKNKPRKRKPKPRSHDSTDSDEDDDSDDHTNFPPRRRRSDGDDDDPPGAGSRGGSGQVTRRTPTGGRPPARSRSRSNSNTGSRKGGTKDADADVDADAEESATPGSPGAGFNVAGDHYDWETQLPAMFAIALSLDDGSDTDSNDMPLTFCKGVTFHEDNIFSGYESPHIVDVSGEDDDIEPCDSVSQQPSISASSNSDTDGDVFHLAAAHEETDTEILDLNFGLDEERPVSERAGQTCYLDDPRCCGTPLPVAPAEATAATEYTHGGGDTPIKLKEARNAPCAEDETPPTV